MTGPKPYNPDDETPAGELVGAFERIARPFLPRIPQPALTWAVVGPAHPLNQPGRRMPVLVGPTADVTECLAYLWSKDRAAQVRLVQYLYDRPVLSVLVGPAETE